MLSLECNEVYYCENFNDVLGNNFIFKHNGSSSFFIPSLNSISNKRFTVGSFTGSDLCRLATPEEKHWLDYCILANKYVEYEEAMKHYVEPIIVNKEFIKDPELDEILIKLLNL